MRNKLIISEEEKRSILYQHKSNFGWLNEQVNYYKNKEGKIVKLEGPMSPPSGTEPATEQEYLAQNPIINVIPPQGQTKTTTSKRFSTTVCPGKDTKNRCDNTVLKIQVRMNDECTDLNPKLAEDGVIGKKTIAAWGICKSKLTSTKTVQGGGGESTTMGSTTTQGSTVVQGPKIGEPLTADDIATLTS
jgi:hypothetical protein